MLIFILTVLWLLNIASKLHRFIKARRLYNRFASGKEMTSYISEVDELFHRANTSERVAYVCDEPAYRREVNKVFSVTIGVYRKQLKEALFPVHLLSFPNRFLEKRNPHAAAWKRHLFSLLFWCISFLASYFLNFLLDELFSEPLRLMLDRILSGKS